MLRDCLLCGIRDKKVQHRRLAEPNLKSKKAFELVQAAEIADTSANLFPRSVGSEPDRKLS